MSGRIERREMKWKLFPQIDDFARNLSPAPKKSVKIIYDFTSKSLYNRYINQIQEKSFFSVYMQISKNNKVLILYCLKDDKN